MKGQRSEDFKTYLKEGQNALSILRDELGWTENISSRLHETRLKMIPKLSTYIRMYFGYDGIKIYNSDIKKPDNEWRLEKYKWLP